MNDPSRNDIQTAETNRFTLKVPDGMKFADLDLRRDPSAEVARFSTATLHKILEFSGIVLGTVPLEMQGFAMRAAMVALHQDALKRGTETINTDQETILKQIVAHDFAHAFPCYAEIQRARKVSGEPSDSAKAFVDRARLEHLNLLLIDPRQPVPSEHILMNVSVPPSFLVADLGLQREPEGHRILVSADPIERICRLSSIDFHELALGAPHRLRALLTLLYLGIKMRGSPIEAKDDEFLREISHGFQADLHTSAAIPPSVRTH